MSYIYLASPYSHPNVMRQAERYTEALKATRWLLIRRQWVYSPIVHCHNIATTFGLPGNYEFWHDYNLAMMDSAHNLYLLNIEGLYESRGVKAELKDANRRKNMGLYLLTPHADEYILSAYHREPTL